MLISADDRHRDETLDTERGCNPLQQFYRYRPLCRGRVCYAIMFYLLG